MIYVNLLTQALLLVKANTFWLWWLLGARDSVDRQMVPALMQLTGWQEGHLTNIYLKEYFVISKIIDLT